MTHKHLHAQRPKMPCMSLSTSKLWELVLVPLLLTFNIFHILLKFFFIAEAGIVEIPSSKGMKNGKSCYSVHMISRRPKCL